MINMIEIHIKTHDEYVDTLRNITEEVNYNEIALALTRLEEIKLELLELASSCKPEFKVEDK